MVIVPCTWKRDFKGLKEATFSGHIVADLGLILEKGLKWKAQLRNVISLSLCKPWRHVWESGCIASLILNLGARWD
jgi:hypothetical protein